MERLLELPKLGIGKKIFKSSLPILQKELIFIIDDCRSLIELHRSILEEENFDVLTAASGKEALLSLTQIRKPSLILLDMQMEGMNGLEFLLELEKALPEIICTVPVVFLTSLKSVPKSRAIGCIQKPTHKKKFLEAVHHYIKMGALSHFKSYICD